MRFDIMLNLPSHSMNDPWGGGLSMEILITLPFSESVIQPLQHISPDIHVHVYPAHKPEEIPYEVWQQTEVLYTDRLIPDSSLAPNLRWIQFHWAGVDHAIDHPALHREGLICTTLSGAAATQVAEFVVMMLLALGHRLMDLRAAQQRAEWSEDRWTRFLPVELRDHFVGILGYGSIGRQVARCLHAFGAQVVATKRNAKDPRDMGYVPEGFGDVEGKYLLRLYPPEALKSMVRICDFVIVTLPLTDKTRHIVNADLLREFKPTAYLVDVSRGGVVDLDALVQSLNEGRLAGAALDVFPQEPLPKDHPVWQMPNVIVTPHISGITPHYNERAVQLLVTNLKRYLKKEPLLNCIDFTRGY